MARFNLSGIFVMVTSFYQHITATGHAGILQQKKSLAD
jgi:hypothetical protein